MKKREFIKYFLATNAAIATTPANQFFDLASSFSTLFKRFPQLRKQLLSSYAYNSTNELAYLKLMGEMLVPAEFIYKRSLTITDEKDTHKTEMLIAFKNELLIRNPSQAVIYVNLSKEIYRLDQLSFDLQNVASELIARKGFLIIDNFQVLLEADPLIASQIVSMVLAHYQSLNPVVIGTSVNLFYMRQKVNTYSLWWEGGSEYIGNYHVSERSLYYARRWLAYVKNPLAGIGPTYEEYLSGKLSLI